MALGDVLQLGLQSFWVLATQFYRIPKVPQVNLTGRTILITGANSGMGYDLARHLIKSRPETLVIVCRRLDAGEKARKEILAELPPDHGVDVRVWYADMMDFASVKALGERAEKELGRLDILVSNAGINTGLKVDDMVFTKDGWERNVETNILSAFLLIFLLLPLLHRTLANPLAVPTSQPSIPDPFIPRIIFNGSEIHSFAETQRLDKQAPLAGLNDKSKWDNPARYPLTKLCNHLLARTLIKVQPTLAIVDVNPGIVASGFIKDKTWTEWIIVGLTGRTSEVGARILGHAALFTTKSVKFWSESGPVKETPARYVTSAEGQQLEQTIWTELIEILEKVVPGCSESVTN